MSFSGNKGEWSELYAMMQLLGQRKLFAADQHLNRLNEIYFPVIQVFRREKDNRKLDYLLSDDSVIETCLNDMPLLKLKSEDFQRIASCILKEVKRASDAKIQIPEVEGFLYQIGCQRLAAPSSDITDIKLRVHDINTGVEQVMGFSVKSYIGGAPTLLNASDATNFVYEVTGIETKDIDRINAIDTRRKILDRIQAIYALGGRIQYAKLSNKTFAGNLQMIDSQMEYIIAEMLLDSFSGNIKNCWELVQNIETTNPLGFPWEGFYEHKVKSFLCAKALGMKPGKRWTGIDDASGGYIVVKANGEVVAFHIYNRDEFMQYLFDNTYFDRASTSRHGYASLYSEGGRIFIKLNLQIRFREQ